MLLVDYLSKNIVIWTLYKVTYHYKINETKLSFLWSLKTKQNRNCYMENNL